MKKINSSLKRFERLNSPLGKRQPSGSLDKRQANALNLKVLMRKKPQLDMNGNVMTFETVFDTGIERNRLYCVTCGTMKRESDNVCRICKADFDAGELLSDCKFDILCRQCLMPFYLNRKFYSSEIQFRKDSHITGQADLNENVCNCFVEIKSEYAKNLRFQAKLSASCRKVEQKAKRISALNSRILEINNCRVRLNEIEIEQKAAQFKFQKNLLFRESKVLLSRISELHSEIALDKKR